MSSRPIENANIRAIEPLVTPRQLHAELPLTARARATVEAGRDAVRAILDRRDPRLLVVVGPCSIHDPAAALEYAGRLVALAPEVAHSLLLVLRAYFEKPRTTVGWKGLINDPHMDDTFRMQDGLRIARRLLLDVAELGLPAATEALDPISPQYLQDLISWSAIGARTAESQTHREMSSGLSTPVGFKNGTDGSLEVAIHALQSVAHPHSFLGIDAEGKVSIVHTTGNRYAHIVLRGGNGKPNYDSLNVALAEQALAKAKVSGNILIDASHANSNKDPALQPLVLDDVVNQIAEGNRSIIGVMIESHLRFGSQRIPADRSQLEYGVSVTDACIDWATTEQALRAMAHKLRDALPRRAGAG